MSTDVGIVLFDDGCRLLVFRKVTPLLAFGCSWLPDYQDDHFIPTLSAWEVITFHASLVLPAAAGRMGRRRRCAEVLAAMGLSRQGGTLVSSL